MVHVFGISDVQANLNRNARSLDEPRTQSHLNNGSHRVRKSNHQEEITASVKLNLLTDGCDLLLLLFLMGISGNHKLEYIAHSCLPPETIAHKTVPPV